MRRIYALEACDDVLGDLENSLAIKTVTDKALLDSFDKEPVEPSINKEVEDLHEVLSN